MTFSTSRCSGFSGLLPLLALLGIPFTLSATTLVAVWTPERLLIGADSRVSFGPQLAANNACKIAQEGSTFFALSGLAENAATGFQAGGIAREVARTGNGLPAVLESFVQRVQSPLQREVDLLKQEAPGEYAYLQQGHPVLQVIFAGVQAGAPALGVVGFQVDPAGSLQPLSRMVADGDDHRGPRIIYAGQQGQIRQYLGQHRDWYQSESSELVKHLIQMEVDAGTGYVDAPIDILAVGPNRAQWLQKKPGCTEVQQVK